MQDSGLSYFFERFGFSWLPLMLAAIFGVVWTIVNWKKGSTPATIAVVAFAVLVLFSCVFPAIETWMPRLFLRNAGLQGIQTFVWIMRGIHVSESLCLGLCVAALGVAAFMGRAAMPGKKDKKKRDLDEDEEEERPAKKKRDRDEED